MAETGNQLSRNPNMCASCSSMADGLDDETGSTSPLHAEPNFASLPETRQQLAEPEHVAPALP